MKSPLFSIILPTYNRLPLLQRAVDSVLAQEYGLWELIIIDDGSTDDTKAYILALDNKKIRYTYQENKGRSTARNLGIEQAYGEYICFLDSDDELLTNYLSCFHNIINLHSYKLILAGVRLVDSNSSITILPSSDTSMCIKQCLVGFFNLMPFCFHNSLIKNNRFDKGLYYGEDFNFFLPVVANNDITICKNDTSIVHQHSNRTINRVFDNAADGYKQFQKSVINTIDKNSLLLLKFVDAETLTKIKRNKVKEFILTAAKYNLKEAYRINKTQNIVSLNNLRLLFQKIKGKIQSN